MFYPEDFKQRVKKAYPNWEKLHEELDCGEVSSVGLRLHDSIATPYFTLDKILEATSLEELKEEAKREQEKIELYLEWEKIFFKQG